MRMGNPAWDGVCRTRAVAGWLTAIALAIVATFVAPVETQAEWTAFVTAPQLNLRAEPGLWAPVIGQAWQGEHLSLLAGPTADDWYQVQAGDRSGWAFGGGLALDAAGSAAPGETWEAASAERWIDVDRSNQMVTLYEGDVPIASYWAAMGSDPSDDGFFATAVGTYYVYEKIGGLNWTDWGGAWVTNWIGFDANRLNGFHSFLMDPNGQVIPGGDGPTGGCVALAPEAADQVFAFVSVGTRVEVHW